MRITLAVLAVFLLTSHVFAEPLLSEKVPPAVLKAFKEKFPDVKKVEWKLKSDKNYEAEFTRKGVEIAAKFDDKGKWLETETGIEQSALPKEVRATIDKEFKGYKIVETQTVERPGGKPLLYEVHVEKGDEVLKVLLEAKGEIVSKEAKKKKGK